MKKRRVPITGFGFVDYDARGRAQPIREVSARDFGREMVTAQHNVELRATRDGSTFTLLEQGRVVARWKDKDAPNLGGWLSNYLIFNHAVREVAKVEAGTSEKRKRGAARGGKAVAKTTASARAQIAQLAVACRDRAEDPLDTELCKKWAQDYGYTNVDSVKRIVRKVLRE